jgi:hypothetical protein
MLKGGHPMFTLDQVLSILQDAYDSGGNFQDAFERLYLYLISSNPIQTIRRRRRNFQISWIYNFHSFPTYPQIYSKTKTHGTGGEESFNCPNVYKFCTNKSRNRENIGKESKQWERKRTTIFWPIHFCLSVCPWTFSAAGTNSLLSHNDQ